MNEGALNDPRITTVFDDAYRYIRNDTSTYDAIYLDFPYVQDYNLSKLYSREFYHFVRQRLAPDGFVVLDAPGIKRPSQIRDIYLNTIQTAGFAQVRPYISVLEANNSEAISILRRGGYSYGRIRSTLDKHVSSLRYDFVIARNAWPDAPVVRPTRRSFTRT